MTRIDGPFARSERLGFSLLALLESNPEQGNSELAKLVRDAQNEIEGANDAICYRITGPEPAKATPMQYGGFFLERDRELLSLAGERQANLKNEVWLLVDAGADAYLDFVSDLPADVFCWDANRTGFALSEMRLLRKGRLCTNEPGSDEDFEAIGSHKEADRVA